MTETRLPGTSTQPIRDCRNSRLDQQVLRRPWCGGDYSILAQTQKVMPDFGIGVISTGCSAGCRTT